MQRLHVDRRLGGPIPSRTKDIGSTFLKLGLPLRDLVGVNVKVLGQLRQRQRP